VLKDYQKVFVNLSKKRPSKQWLEEEMDFDRKLHSLIAENCGNSRLAEEIERCATLVQALRDVVGNDQIATIEAVEDHLIIIKEMLAGNADAAAKAMSRHIDRASIAAEKAIFSHKNA